MKTLMCVFLLTFIATGFASDASPKIAFLEFQNKAGTIIITNRWTMAEDLAKRLKKINKRIEIVPRKEILTQLSDLKWIHERLEESQESKLASIGADYAVYGNIVRWWIQGAYSNTEVQDTSEANVIFLINVVNLSTGETVKSFSVDGSATGETGFIHEGDPSVIRDDSQFEDQMYEATEVATNKAADILSELFQ